MLKLNQRFFILNFSPWPIITSFNFGNFLFSLIISYKYLIVIAILGLFISIIGWLNEIKLESWYMGEHTLKQNDMLYFGFLLFLLSEILIFATLIGSYFYNSLNPSIELFNKYPYDGIITIDKYSYPTLNTFILYFSGLSCTIAINNLYVKNKNKSFYYLIITLILSTIFSYIQYIEYINSPFSIIDGIYGTNFFILTGFHGIHVICGTLFLIYTAYRIYYNTLTIENSTGIICSSIYWHFVDYLWLILYIFLYLWGS